MNILTEIGGTGQNSDGSKVLEPIVHALIAPEFLPNISWSGRGRGKELKIALSKYTRIINLIAEIVNMADGNFDHLRTLKDLKYKILKYAPAKYGSKDRTNQSDVNNTNLPANVADSKYVKITYFTLIRKQFRTNLSVFISFYLILSSLSNGNAPIVYTQIPAAKSILVRSESSSSEHSSNNNTPFNLVQTSMNYNNPNVLLRLPNTVPQQNSYVSQQNAFPHAATGSAFNIVQMPNVMYGNYGP